MGNRYNPKILFLTIPLREKPTEFPPYGIMSVMQYLRNEGYDDIHLLNQDYVRFSNKKILGIINDLKPDIIGISAVVSTGYEYVKNLSIDIKLNFGKIPIIIGGPLGASAELILKNTGVDIVCLSEGELVMSDLLSIKFDPEKFESVKGIFYCNQNGEFKNTGYARQLEKDLMYEVDYEDLNQNEGEFDYYIPKVFSDHHVFSQDSRCEKYYGSRAIDIPGSKGCVAKCTFCHRWDKGIRYLTVDIIMDRFKELIEKYNVRFVIMSDENFGTDKKWLKEFCEKIKKLDLFWYVSGMRVNCIDSKSIKMMKDAGCIRAVFGMETGSSRMLKIMNKGVKIEDNYNALKLIYENGMNTTVQIVLGMPGENWETVMETCEFLKYSISQNEDISPLNCSINYAQALPGTPLYEYARHKSLITNEEEYLLWIANKEAADDLHHLNGLSGLPKLVVLSWRPYLMASLCSHYIELYGKSKYKRILAKVFEPEIGNRGYFNIPKENNINTSDYFLKLKFKTILRSQLYLFPKLFSNSRLFLYFYTLERVLFNGGLKVTLKIIFEYLKYLLILNGRKSIQYQSLRKTIFDLTNQFEKEPIHMRPLRKGRW